MPADWTMLRAAPPLAESWNSGVNAGNAYADRVTARADKEELKNAYALAASDPVAGGSALTRAGRPDAAVSTLAAGSALRKYDAQQAASPYLAKGDVRGAAAAAAPIDADYSEHLSQLGAAELDRKQKLGQYSAGIIMAASKLPDPAQRRAYIDRNAARLADYGMPPEAIAGYDVNDPMVMRADAAKFMSLSDTAGSIKTEKFGDNAVTYQTDPVRGVTEVSRTPIPKTRAELLAERRAKETEDYHDATITARDQALSPTKIVGEIYSKMERGETLTKGEKAVLDHYSTGKMNPLIARALDGSLGADDEEEDDDALADSPPPTARAAPPAVAPKSKTITPEAIAHLREGKPLTFNNGQTWTLRGGKPTRLR